MTSEGAEDDTGVVLGDEPYVLDPVFLPTSELYDGRVMPQVVIVFVIGLRPCVHALRPRAHALRPGAHAIMRDVACTCVEPCS